MLGGVLLWRLQSADTYAHTTYRSPDHPSTLAPGALPLAVVNNAVTILSVQIPVPVSAFTFFFDIYSKVELLDHMVILRLIFFEESHPFLQQLYHFTSPPATHKGSNSSVSLTKKNNNV